MKPIPEIDTAPVVYDASAVAALRNPSASSVKIIPKGSQSAIIRARRTSALKRIKEIENELGRMARLLNELRDDLQLTTE